MKPKHQRLIFILISMVLLCAGVLLTMQAFKENLVYFYSPSDIAASLPALTQKIRVGGLVEKGSVIHGDGQTVEFTVTDGKNSLRITYTGILPNLFREGQGMIAEGTFDGNLLTASTILAKHDEKYMPKEVVDALKKTGHWEGDATGK